MRPIVIKSGDRAWVEVQPEPLTRLNHSTQIWVNNPYAHRCRRNYARSYVALFCDLNANVLTRTQTNIANGRYYGYVNRIAATSVVRQQCTHRRYCIFRHEFLRRFRGCGPLLMKASLRSLHPHSRQIRLVDVTPSHQNVLDQISG